MDNKTLFYESSLETAIRTGTKQCVILGDSADFISEEILKRTAVYRVNNSDFIEEKLREEGFDTTKKTFFIWVGKSFYLKERDVEIVFEKVAELSADGSSLLFDFAKSDGKHIKSCFDELDLQILLERYGFLVYGIVQGVDTCLIDTDKVETMCCLAVLKRKKVRNTKEIILSTALGFFAVKGYETVSVRDIAGEIGITQAALYKHYKSKRDIFEKILERMENFDFDRAVQYEVPEDTYLKMSEKYKNVSFQKVIAYSAAQFRFWTEDDFASRFRKMIAIEQFKNEEMMRLYSQYLTSGPLEYMADIFKEFTQSDDNARMLALKFYAPIYFLITIYDSERDKKRISKMLEQHINDFAEEFNKI